MQMDNDFLTEQLREVENGYGLPNYSSTLWIIIAQCADVIDKKI